MCQLLGMNCNTPTDVQFSFTGFVQRGGRTDHHSDGWGIAFFEGRATRIFIDTTAACSSPVADFLRSYPIKSCNVISHIRKATEGAVTLENCHPFVREQWGQYWVFAHNGDLKNYHPPLSGACQPVGQTDSERAFCFLLQELARRASQPKIEAITSALHDLVAQIAQFGAFNFLLSNGQALWAHASTKLCFIERRHPFSSAQLADSEVEINFADHTQPSDRVAVIATTPLTTNESWTAFAPGELKVFVDGAVQA